MWMLKKKGVSFFHKAEPKKKKMLASNNWNQLRVAECNNMASEKVFQKLICARKGLLLLMVVVYRRSFLSWSCRCVLSL